VEQTQPSILGYEDALERDRISIEPRGDGLRVITPPLRHWRHVGRGFRIAIISLATIVLFMLIMAITGGAEERHVGLANAGMYGAILAIVVAFAYRRVRGWFVFNVTRDALSIRRMLGRSVTSTMTVRRDAVGEIRASRYNRTLVIQITGRTMFQLYVSNVPADVQRVAEALAGAVAANVQAVDRSLPVMMDEPARAMSSSDRRTALLALTCGAAIAALMAASLWGLVIGIVVFLAAMMPCGIILGTQRKQFWP
jgi:hypothetical protein